MNIIYILLIVLFVALIVASIIVGFVIMPKKIENKGNIIKKYKLLSLIFVGISFIGLLCSIVFVPFYKISNTYYAYSVHDRYETICSVTYHVDIKKHERYEISKDESTKRNVYFTFVNPDQKVSSKITCTKKKSLLNEKIIENLNFTVIENDYVTLTTYSLLDPIDVPDYSVEFIGYNNDTGKYKMVSWEMTNDSTVTITIKKI